jgi:hypothetical protein
MVVRLTMPYGASSHLEVKISPNAKVYVRGFYFTNRDAIECEVRFMIDSYTIKRRNLKKTWLSSATR